MVDVLGWPVVGRLLKWRHARTAIQLGFLLVAVVLVAQGLFGSQVAPDNLATVVTWVHYRGLLVIALLAAGNLFCTGCPFVLVRDVGRRVHRPTLRWPRWLRTKWIAHRALRSCPVQLRAVRPVGAAAGHRPARARILRSGARRSISCFPARRSASTCARSASSTSSRPPCRRWSCASSQPERCRTCRTFDCIKGNRQTGQRGCELGLFLPSKVGNLDCTFCLDCVQACPHDNVALAARVPGAELLDLRRRSGIGRLASAATSPRWRSCLPSAVC